MDTEAARNALDRDLADCMRPRVRRAMERVGEHPVPAGPLAVRWLAYELAEGQRAGVATRSATCDSRTPVRRRGAHEEVRRPARVPLARSPGQRDRLGRAANALPEVVRPGETVELSRRCRPRPPGGTGLPSTSSRSSGSGSRISGPQLDILSTCHRYRRERLGVRVHGPVDLGSKRRSPGRRNRGHGGAVAVAHLVSAAVPTSDWSRLLLDAHAEGYAAVGQSDRAGSTRRSASPRSLGARRGTEPAWRAAPLAVAPHRARASRARRAPRLRRTRPLVRRPSRRPDFGRDPVVRAAEDEGPTNASATAAATSV